MSDAHDFPLSSRTRRLNEIAFALAVYDLSRHHAHWSCLFGLPITVFSHTNNRILHLDSERICMTICVPSESILLAA